MRADAVLSGLAGVVGIPLAAWLAEASGTTVAFEKAMSVFFIGFSAVVLVLSTGRSVKSSGMALIIGNVLFTVGAVALVVVGLFPLTTLGVALILGTGVYTLAMAELQYVGWRRAYA
jgi:CHASE2 domain-containing sensor protein